MRYTVELNDYWSAIDARGTDFVPAGGLATAVDSERNVAYLYGGDTLGKANDRLYAFDLGTGTIRVVAALPLKDRINHRMYWRGGDRLCIVGGASLSDRNNPATIELQLYDLKRNEIETVVTPIPFRNQFGSCYDAHTDTVYLYGGFGRNDFHAIRVADGSVSPIELGRQEDRAGPVCEFLAPDTVFVFSGFSARDGVSVCHNDYLLARPGESSCETVRCTEPFGRSFAKSVVVEALHKVLIFGGTHNGMEGSGAFYFYDYREGVFNVANIQGLPVGLTEPAMVYSEKNHAVYIVGGFLDRGAAYQAHDYVMKLDLAAVPAEAWTGHPEGAG